jgi:hypothetical protein
MHNIACRILHAEYCMQKFCTRNDWTVSAVEHAGDRHRCPQRVFLNRLYETLLSDIGVTSIIRHVKLSHGEPTVRISQKVKKVFLDKRNQADEVNSPASSRPLLVWVKWHIYRPRPRHHNTVL